VLSVYVIVVGGLGALFNTQNNPLLAVLATGLVAVMFQPLRQRLQRAVNRLMYGDRDDPAAAINRLGQRLEAALAPEAVLPSLTETVAQALRLPYAAILLRQDDAFTLAAAYTANGQPPSPPDPLSPPQGGRGGDVVPFIYQGEVIGQLVVAPRAPGEPLEPADRRLLEQMARQASPAVHAVRLAADLQRSRERLVTAREEERRRLRRDLHDGIGSTLAALHLQAGGLRALLAGQPPSPPDPLFPPQGGRGGEGADPPNASTTPPFPFRPWPPQRSGVGEGGPGGVGPALGGVGPLPALDDLRAQIRAAVGEVRRVVYDLRPPALDELGLAGAIRARAAQLEQGGDLGPERGVPVSVDAPDSLPPLPAAVEVAAYYIAQEALTNVARHAQAKQCRVRLWLGGPEYWAGGGLGLEIEDDGVGLPAARPAGVGLRSMQERAEELGGVFRLLPRPGGGTLVSVWLPLPGYTPAHG
jgi:signal transduction histidine kinase